MGLNCKPVDRMKSIMRKVEDKLAEEAKLQKEKKESKKNNEHRRKSI